MKLRKEDYPAMPQHFSDCVDDVVRTQLQEISDNDIKRKDIPMKHTHRTVNFRRAAIGIAACLAVMISSVAALQHYGLLDFLSPQAQGSDPSYVINHTQSDFPQTVLDNVPEELRRFVRDQDTIYTDALLHVQQVYFDGAQLHIYAEPTAEGAKLEARSERVFIDGVQYPAELRFYPEANAYYGAVSLSDAALNETFSTELVTSIYPRGGTESAARLGFQTLAFTVSVSDNTAKVIAVSDIDLPSGSVVVSRVAQTPSTLSLRFTYHFSDKKLAEQMANAGLALSDSNGAEYDYMLNSNGGEVISQAYRAENGDWCVDRSVDFVGVPTDITSFTLIPYEFVDLKNSDLSRDANITAGTFTVPID